MSATSIELAGLEANFGDGKFAGAGVAPANPSLIADNTVTTLNSVGNLFELTSDTSGTGPLLELNGSVVTSGQFTAKLDARRGALDGRWLRSRLQQQLGVCGLEHRR